MLAAREAPPPRRSPKQNAGPGRPGGNRRVALPGSQPGPAWREPARTCLRPRSRVREPGPHLDQPICDPAMRRA
jgi:hypothetical protein